MSNYSLGIYQFSKKDKILIYNDKKYKVLKLTEKEMILVEL
jgi:hypothetical protein